MSSSQMSGARQPARVHVVRARQWMEENNWTWAPLLRHFGQSVSPVRCLSWLCSIGFSHKCVHGHVCHMVGGTVVSCMGRPVGLFIRFASPTHGPSLASLFSTFEITRREFQFCEYGRRLVDIFFGTYDDEWVRSIAIQPQLEISYYYFFRALNVW